MGTSSPTTYLYADEMPVGEAARLAGCSTDTIRRAADSGLIRCRRLPASGYRRVSRSDVERVFGVTAVSR
jgi:excisionase family DNA binding protein